MDNLTHTLIGAALAETGLKHRTRLGTATLLIGANFPDIDVITVPLGVGLEWRRGVTHGVLALVVLPFVLGGLMWLADRHARRAHEADRPADFRQLVALSAIAIATHPTLDFMNTYGMRWLMPFVDRWFYADGLFIADPYLMLALAAGVVLSRRARSGRPAQLALAACAAYIVAMLGLTTAGRARSAAAFAPAQRFMVAPAPLVPWRRDVVIEDDDAYRMGQWSPFSQPTLTDGTIATGDRDPAVTAALQTSEARQFLRWARLPFYRVIRDGAGTVVRIADARYMGDDARGWAAIEVRLP